MLWIAGLKALKRCTTKTKDWESGGMHPRTVRTPIAQWLDSQDRTNEWLRDFLKADVTVNAVQHWVSGRKPIPRKYRAQIDALLENQNGSQTSGRYAVYSHLGNE